MTRLLLVVVVAIACASCSDGVAGSYTGRGSLTSPDSQSTAIGVRLSSERLGFRSFAHPSCSFGRGFETTFDVLATGGSGANLDRVTLRMIDGTNLGSALTFPSPELGAMFGSTVLFGTRTFRFTPQFGCLAAAPQSLTIEVLFRERTGTMRTFTLHARF
jgi:hypothetical protein